MTDAEDEDPRELMSAEFARTPDMIKRRAESERRARWIRGLRVANGFDHLIARLLEAK